ncbi:MAG: hypothetical protein RLO52_26500 [Sandaracinaceae bacterium]
MGSKDHVLQVVAVGWGKGGGRLAAEWSRRGHHAIAFHSSRDAADSQANLPKERCHAIGHERGGVESAEQARRLLRDNARRIDDLVRMESRDADLLLVTACLGGRTGSSVDELVELLDDKRVPVIVLATLPADGEPVARKIQALHAVRALTRAEPDGLILVDGARVAEGVSDVSIFDLHDRANERILEPLDALLTQDDPNLALRPLSAERIRDVLIAGGLVSFGAAELRALGPEEVSDAIRDALDDNPVLASGVDAADLSDLAIVIEADKPTLESTPVRLLDHLREHWRTETNGACVDVAVHRASDGASPRVRVLASAAAIPRRVEDLVTETATEALSLRQKVRRVPELDLGQLEDLETASRPKPERVRRVSDVAPKARAADPTPTAEEAPAEPAPHTPEPDFANDRRVAANRAVYARLVTRYKSTTNDELQRAIARRLEQDRLSEDPHIRFLAVDAMGKIGAHVFDASLVASTEDDSPAVRGAAERALAGGHPTRAFA